MSATRRLLVWLAAALIAVGAVSGTATAGPPSKDDSRGGAFRHDGVFVRLALGGGYTRVSEGRTGGDIEVSGFGLLGSLDVGGVITRDLALHLSIFGTGSPSPSVSGEGAGSVTEGAAAMAAIGIGVTYFFMPLNLYVGTSFGAAVGRTEVTPTTIDSHVGFAVSLLVGKEWWIDAQWGIGVAAQVVFGHLPTDHDAIQPLGVGLVLSATYN